MKCESCGKPVSRRTEVNGKWVGVCCVPDDIFKMYPGWKKRVQADKKK